MVGKHTSLCCPSEWEKLLSLWLCQGHIYINYELLSGSSDITVQESSPYDSETGHFESLKQMQTSEINSNALSLDTDS